MILGGFNPQQWWFNGYISCPWYQTPPFYGPKYVIVEASYLSLEFTPFKGNVEDPCDFGLVTWLQYPPHHSKRWGSTIPDLSIWIPLGCFILKWTTHFYLEKIPSIYHMSHVSRCLLWTSHCSFNNLKFRTQKEPTPVAKIFFEIPFFKDPCIIPSPWYEESCGFTWTTQAAALCWLSRN